MSGKSFKELFNESIKIFKENIVNILLITLFVFIPVAIANVFIAGNVLDDNLIEQYLNNKDAFIDTQDYEKVAILSSITRQIFTYIAISVVIALFSLAGDIFVIKIVQDSTNNIKRSFMEVFEESLRKFPSVLWAFLVSNIMIAFGLLLIFPGIFLYFLFSFTIQVAVLFKLTGIRAIRYGSYVAKKNLLKVVGYAVLAFVFSIVVSFITSLPIEFIQNESIENIINVIKQSIDSLILCFPTILFTLLFLDMQRAVEENVNTVFNINQVEGQS